MGGKRGDEEWDGEGVGRVASGRGERGGDGEGGGEGGNGDGGDLGGGDAIGKGGADEAMQGANINTINTTSIAASNANAYSSSHSAVCLMVFDVLVAKGAVVLERPWLERRRLAYGMVKESVGVVEIADGRAVYEDGRVTDVRDLVGAGGGVGSSEIAGGGGGAGAGVDAGGGAGSSEGGNEGVVGVNEGEGDAEDVGVESDGESGSDDGGGRGERAGAGAGGGGGGEVVDIAEEVQEGCLGEGAIMECMEEAWKAGTEGLVIKAITGVYQPNKR